MRMTLIIFTDCDQQTNGGQNIYGTSLRPMTKPRECIYELRQFTARSASYLHCNWLCLSRQDEKEFTLKMGMVRYNDSSNYAMWYQLKNLLLSCLLFKKDGQPGRSIILFIQSKVSVIQPITLYSAFILTFSANWKLITSTTSNDKRGDS